MDTEITLTVTPYQCDACTEREGRPVTELVRMMKAPMLLNGTLVADEYWGCPHCLEPRFPVRKGGRKPPQPRPRTRPKLVVSNP